MSLFQMLGFIAVASVVIGIVVAIRDSSRRKALGTALAGLADFTASSQCLGSNGAGVALDDERRKVCLLSRDATDEIIFRVVSDRDVISCEIAEDGESISRTVRSSQIGGAIVGVSFWAASAPSSVA